MKKRIVALAVGALGLGTWGCGGDGNANGNPGSPSPSNGNAVTINIVAINGAQSFTPNPATVPAGQMVVWHNVDNVTHRVVLNDRSVDTGNLAPGAVSPPTVLGTVGPYHCSIHPEMVGSVTR